MAAVLALIASVALGLPNHSPPVTTIAEPAPAIAPATSGTLACIRWWESRDRYGAVSPRGRYRGAYQFDLRTWLVMGGTGDPATASPPEQDLRASLLLTARGLQPWGLLARARCA